MSTKCIIYARFSPRPDEDTSESADKQTELCIKYAEKRGYTVVETYEDRGKSRNESNRPGLLMAIGAIKRGYVLLCYDISRFGAGSTAVVFEQDVIRRGGTVEFVSGMSVADSPDTKMIRGIMYAVKEREREMIAERTQVQMLLLQKSGHIVSGDLPYGFKRDPENPKKMIPHEYEYPALQEMITMHHEGESLSQIARSLEKHGDKARRGTKWHPTTVRRSLIRAGALLT